MKRHGSPGAITTDGLRSYGAAIDDLGNRDKRPVGRHADNRVENSHLPFRPNEGAMLIPTNAKSPEVRISARQRPQRL